MDDKEAGVTLTLLKSERVIDGVRWVVAFVAVLLAYGVAGWMLLRPTGWQLGVNAPVVEINLGDMPQISAVSPSDRGSEPAGPANPTRANAPTDLPASADNQQKRSAERAAGSLATRIDASAARDAEAMDAKDVPVDAAEKAAALEQADKPAITQPGPPADGPPEAPAKTEATAADSGGGRPITAPPRVVSPDTSNAASIARAPIDTSITVNQGRSLLRSAKGGPQFRSVPPLQLKFAAPLATQKDRNEPFSKKPSFIAGSTLPTPISTPLAPSHGLNHDVAQKPAMSADGGLARNAIGVVIKQRAVVAHAGAPLSLHPLSGAASPSTAMYASREHSATTAAGAPLAGGHVKASDAGLSTGTGSQWPAGLPGGPPHASHIASSGGPAVSGNGMSRLASGTGAVSPAKVAAGGLNGSSFRPKYP